MRTYVDASVLGTKNSASRALLGDQAVANLYKQRKHSHLLHGVGRSPASRGKGEGREGEGGGEGGRGGGGRTSVARTTGKGGGLASSLARVMKPSLGKSHEGYLLHNVLEVKLPHDLPFSMHAHVWEGGWVC